MNIKIIFFLFFFFLLVSSISTSDCNGCVVQTKASYFSSASALSGGACGYGSSAINITSGHLAAAVPSLYKDGSGCGACFQIRCKNTTLCTKEGSRIIVTDVNPNNQTDFILSSQAFKAMAYKGLGSEVLKQKIVSVEYKRVPCEYKNNFGVYIEETSKKGEYLAVKFLYQGGQTELVAVDVAQVGSSKWTFMIRKGKGAVWETSTRVPSGALQFRIVVIGGFDARRYWIENVIPADWKVGVTYDTGVKVNDIAADGCSECENSWK